MPDACSYAADPLRPAMPLALAATALSLLLGLLPASTEIYLPALPVLTRALAAPVAMAQLTMSALMLDFGITQMVWGSVADRVGRRPVLLVDLAPYTASSAGRPADTGIESLVLWRVLQGAAVAAAVVCAHAIVRDLCDPVQDAQVLALAFGVGRWRGGALDGSTRTRAYGQAFWASMTCTVAWTQVLAGRA